MASPFSSPPLTVNRRSNSPPVPDISIASPTSPPRNYSRPSSSSHSPTNSTSAPTETPFRPPEPSRNTTESSKYTSLKYADGEGGDLGGGTLGEPSMASRRKDKGKGRMRDLSEEEVELQDSQRWGAGGGHAYASQGNGSAGMEDGQGEALSPEEEERREEERVASNLANWARLEKSRRQTQRRTSTLVLPSGPPIPAPITAGAVDLARRGSSLIRRASARSTSGGGAKERRGSVRRGSKKLEDETSTGAGSGMGRGTLDEVTEEGLDSPTSSPRPSNTHRPILGINTSLTNSTPSTTAYNPASTTSPTSATDPFASPSSVRHPSLDVPETISAKSHVSRFIEDLPPQTPTGSPSHTPTQSVSNPLETTPVQRGARKGESLDDLLPTGRPSMSGPAAPPFSEEYDGRPSTSTGTGGGFDTDGILLPRPSLQDPYRPQPLSRNSDASYITQSTGNRSYMAIDDNPRYGTDGRYEDGDGEGEEEKDDEGLGWFDWLCCFGCWGEESGEDRQMGRTNPSE